jgi:dTDP-4-amino-4,6-dideoxygalactose transaminase
MTEFQGALLRVQLGRLRYQLERRARNLAILEDGATTIPDISPLKRDPRITSEGSGGFGFRLGGRLRQLGKERFVAALKAEGIPCGAGYDTALHRSEALLEDVAARCPDGDVPAPACPVAEAAVQDTLSLPQPVLLGEREDTLDILRALEKVSRSLAQR